MIRPFLGGFALLLLLAATPVRAKVLQPTSQWNVDFGDAHCIALRNYGTAVAPVIFSLKPAPLGDVMQMTVVRPGANKAIDQYDGTLKIGDARPAAVSILGYPAPSGKARVGTLNLSLAAFQPVRSASEVHLRSTGEVDRAFALSDMGAVSRTLDRCVDGLRKAWNIGGAATRISQPAVSLISLPRLFSANDYPRAALRAGASGTVELMTLIDADGKVASCMVIGSSGIASLDAQSCAIITARAKFRPALGLDGKPARSGTIHRIRWQTRN